MALAMNTPLAEALNNRIQPKLVEIGWSVGDDNSPLGEYICLMMVNGKSQEQIAAELSGDLLGLSPGDDSATHFARWLFEELDSLKKSMSENDTTPIKSIETESMDESMGEPEEMMADGTPTAPKAMRQPNGRRIMNQISKAMERKPQDPLHRVRPQSAGIDKFRRDPPRGPANQNGSPRHNNNMNNRHNHRHMNGGRGYRFNNPPMMPPNMTPQQQLAFYQMYQQQAQMMAPFNGPPNQNPFAGPGSMGGPPPGGMPHMPPGGPGDDAYSNNLAQPQRLPPGPSLFDRIQAPPDMNNDVSMDTGNGGQHRSAQNGENEGEAQKLEEVPCKFALNCTKPECPFGHPAPLALPGRLYVSGEKCPYGTRCKNRKCTSSHPSPAAIPSFVAAPTKIDQDCKFFPNCTNPQCPFKHPPMPMCRNGANCTRPDCHFTHSEVACKFNPCLNPKCVYKHEEGQQKIPQPGESFGNKVWTAPGLQVGSGEHVSERKFVNNDGAEELIIPGQDMDTAPLDVE